MAVTFYKLIGYKPFWIQQDGIYPKSHIEEILENTSYNNKRELQNIKKLTREMSNEEHGIPTENYQGENVWHISTTGTLENIADYIKVDANGSIYYYYLVNKTEVLKATKNGENLYEAIYDLDEYMTVGGNKLQIMYEHNPYVYVNTGFGNRGDERYDEGGDIYYVFNYIHQRNIGNTTADRNNLMVRKFAYSTTKEDLFAINFPNLTIPVSLSVANYVTGTTETVSGFNTKMTKANSRGRYKYIVAKSSALMTGDNQSLKPSKTNQKTIIIPVFSDNENDILHALNDFNLSTSDVTILNPFGDNLIGIFECDVPFSILYGYKASNQYSTDIGGIDQASLGHVVFFTIENNAPMLFKIIDYSVYQNGFYGKYLNIINNIYHGLPETEPAMLNPMYYKETYNNGESNITIDASMFVFKGNNRTINSFGVEAYLSWGKDLAIAYNFGDNTNTELVAFDNTETTIGKGSITNFVVGSASANFYTTNASTVSTGVQTRESEQTQAGVDAGLDTAQAGTSVIPKSGLQAINPFFYAKAAATAAISTAKIMTDTAMQQDRANKNFVSGINNITSSPSMTLSDPSIKGIIPNKKGLFSTYSIELQDGDKEVVFTNYLNNGYPLNCMFLFNEIATNRKFMNIMNFNTSYFRDDLMKLLQDNDTTIFNTKFWNLRFLAGLNSDTHIYNTDRLINCTDYMGEAYVDNVENELPEIPVPKENIARFITNFRTSYEARESYVLNALISDNPDAPSDIGDNIYIEQLEFGGFIIQTFEASDDYFGSITVNATCYNGYINDTSTGVRHYFGNVDFLCNTNYREMPTSGDRVTVEGISGTIRCPDGTSYSNKTFNYPIVGNSSVETTISIPAGFLNGCYNYSQDVTIPSYISSIGSAFMYDCSMENNGTYVGTVETAYISGSGFPATYYCLNCNTKKINIYINCPASRFVSSDKTIGMPYYFVDSADANCRANTNKPNTLTNNKTILGTYASEFKSKFPVIYKDVGGGGIYYYGDSDKTQLVKMYGRKG